MKIFHCRVAAFELAPELMGFEKKARPGISVLGDAQFRS